MGIGRLWRRCEADWRGGEKRLLVGDGLLGKNEEYDLLAALVNE